LSLLNAVVCTVLPIWLVMQGVRHLGASMASQVGMIGPLSTLWMASVWLGEPVTPQLLLGTAAILGGVVLLSRLKAPAPPDKAPAQAESGQAVSVRQA
jgi:drug/metabolite transporter (DMT)-like permease